MLMSKKTSLDKILKDLQKERSSIEDLLLISEGGKYYFYDSIYANLNNIIHEVARIRDLLK